MHGYDRLLTIFRVRVLVLGGMRLSCLAMIAHSVQVRATLYRFSGDTAALSTMGFRQHDGSLIVRRGV